MSYRKYKQDTEKMWSEVKKSDDKIKLNEIKPKGIIKKEYEIPLVSKTIKFKSPTLRFNIYYDLKEETKPVILDIHGGGWAYGDKDLNDNFCYHLAKNGYNVVSLTYTTLFKANLKDMLQEIHFLLNHLYENKEKYNLDFNNLFVTGDSAGGELSFLYSAIISNKDLGNIYKIDNYNNLKINAAALNHPAPYIKLKRFSSDYKKQDYKNNRYRMRSILGIFYKFNCYTHYTDPNEIFSKFTNYPPTLIISSKGDSLSIQSNLLDKELTRINIPHKYLFIDDVKYTHVFNVLFPDEKVGLETNNSITSYFDKYLVNK